jgi:uncharacterized protein
MNPMAKTPRQIVLIFLKAPEKGKVKTRLVTHLDEDSVLDLYKCFAADVIETVKKGGYRFQICYDPPDAEDKITEWLGYRYDLIPQIGNDLGERMDQALRKAFSTGVDHAILIGTDLPDLPVEYLEDAFENLKTHDAVIGPAKDGGYYLIGSQSVSYLPKIFENMPWGTPDVFERAIEIFVHQQRRVHILPLWRDIDVIEDLKAFYKTNKNRPNKARNTLAYLQSIGFCDDLE